MIRRYHNTIAGEPFSCDLQQCHHPSLYIMIPRI